MSKKLPRSVNLIETIAPPGDAFTIFYEWTFRIGKYLLIAVQVIVIAVFVMRLSVDKLRNDLTVEINNQVDFLMQPEFRENEAKYRTLQVLFEDFSKLDKAHVKNARKVISVLDSVPGGVTLERFSFSNNDKITTTFQSLSLEEVRKYESFLKQNPAYSDVSLNLEQKGEGGEDIEFRVNYTIKNE